MHVYLHSGFSIIYLIFSRQANRLKTAGIFTALLPSITSQFA